MKKTPSSSSSSPPQYQLSILLHFFTLILSSALTSPSLLRGVHPLDFKYYSSEVIKCKDGLSSFTKDRLNDDFCDCLDGTDEPGTSACPRSKFYCKNMGSQPRFLFSSRVNDNICDCCDGTDEYDGTTYCPNTCIMGSSIEYKAQSHNTTHPNTLQANKERQNGRLEDVMHNLKDLKVLAIIQLIIIAFWAILFFHRRLRLRRQRYQSQIHN